MREDPAVLDTSIREFGGALRLSLMTANVNTNSGQLCTAAKSRSEKYTYNVPSGFHYLLPQGHICGHMMDVLQVFTEWKSNILKGNVDANLWQPVIPSKLNILEQGILMALIYLADDAINIDRYPLVLL